MNGVTAVCMLVQIMELEICGGIDYYNSLKMEGISK